ncbi:hypothetical protein RQP46_002207 [Phenoliferia psychrophenolica]
MPDSLFGSDTDEDNDDVIVQPGARAALARDGTPPLIPGLIHLSHAIPPSLQHSLALASATLFTGSTNQVMQFNTLSPFLSPLLDLIPSLLPPALIPLYTNHSHPRQVIFNLYRPGEGITPHVDLPQRYDDLIIGLSLLAPTVMEWTKPGRETEAVLLRPGDLYIMHGEARFEWEHGIPARMEDVVEDREGEQVVLKRRTRISITLRRMREGADLVGGDDTESEVMRPQVCIGGREE